MGLYLHKKFVTGDGDGARGYPTCHCEESRFNRDDEAISG
jgi:hypothetical protein